MSFPVPEEGLRVGELLVRPPREDDVEAIAPAFADPSTGGEAGLPPLDADGIRAFMREQLPGLRASGAMIPLVVFDEDGSILGGVNYSRFDPFRETIEIGYWLLPAARGRGVATRVARALADHAFAAGVNRVHAVVRVGNTASERVLERAGFAREGTMRRYLTKDGERHDATLFALVSDA